MNQDNRHFCIPTGLTQLAGFCAPCACGETHSIDTQHFDVAAGSVDRVAAVVGRFCKAGKIGLLADAVTYSIAGREIESQIKSAGFGVCLYIVPNAEGGRPHGTFDAILAAEEALSEVSFVVAVGSGTVNDLAKLSSFRLGVAYMVVPTAPSMNGYTSAIAAIMKDGVKQTIDCHQPIAVVADLDILCAAPPHLIQAGLGDLESKPVSTADFLLSSLLRGTYYCSAPSDVVAAAEARVVSCSSGLATGDESAIRVLTEALLLSGCSMKLAGSSSPASGGEHLMSHYWDMTAAAEDRVEGFHGLQVGVATIVTSTLYETLRKLSPESIDIDALVAKRCSAADETASVAARHGAFGNLAAEQTLAKRLDDAAYRRELEYVVAHWGDIWSTLTMLKTPDEIRSVLKRAGGATTIQQVDLTPAHLKRAFLWAREIRGRFTVLDFAADLGVLESVVDDVLRESGCTE